MGVDLVQAACGLVAGARPEDARLDEAGESHAVVLFPGLAAVRFARTTAARRAAGRRTALLVALGRAAPWLPLPRVLEQTDDAVVHSWMDGAPAGAGEGSASELSRLLSGLAAVDLDALVPHLGAPHEYAGGARWAEAVESEVVAHLAPRAQEHARRRMAAALALPPVRPSLVHGDLAGGNVLWTGGRVTGVLDWDVAQPFDPAVDVACMVSTGWDVRAVVDDETWSRAAVWRRTFLLDWALFAQEQGLPTAERAARLERVERDLTDGVG